MDMFLLGLPLPLALALALALVLALISSAPPGPTPNLLEGSLFNSFRTKSSRFRARVRARKLYLIRIRLRETRHALSILCPTQWCRVAAVMLGFRLGLTGLGVVVVVCLASPAG